MKLKILSVIMALMVFAGCAFAGPFSANAKTKRIPAGTKFSLELLTPVTSVSGRPGAQFSAILVNDQSEGNEVILPSGSLVRGTVSKIVEPQRLSKGAILYMDFDHVVTPNGRQLPLSFSIVGREDLTLDGGIQKRPPRFIKAATAAIDGHHAVHMRLCRQRNMEPGAIGGPSRPGTGLIALLEALYCCGVVRWTP